MPYTRLNDGDELALGSESEEDLQQKAPVLKSIYDTIRLRGFKDLTKAEHKWMDRHQGFGWYLFVTGWILLGMGIFGICCGWKPLNSFPFITTTGDYFNGVITVDTTISQVPLFGIGAIGFLVLGVMQLIVSCTKPLYNQIYMRIIWGRENFIWFALFGTFLPLLYVSVGWLIGIRNWTISLAIAFFMFIMSAVTSLNGWWAKLSALGDKQRYRIKGKNEPADDNVPVSLIFQHAMATGTHYYALTAVKSICGAGFMTIFLYYFIEQALSVTQHWATWVIFLVALIMPICLGISEILHTYAVYRAVKKTESGNLAVLAMSDTGKTNTGNHTTKVYIQWMWVDAIIFMVGISIMYMFFEFRVWL